MITYLGKISDNSLNEDEENKFTTFETLKYYCSSNQFRPPGLHPGWVKPLIQIRQESVK